MRLAAERGVTFDICPISNVRLKVFPESGGPSDSKIAGKLGVNYTVSTDDPLCFANSVNDEYAALAGELQFTRAELAQVARNGWAVANVSAETRKAALDEIARLEKL